jgi:uracil-DNA glycosylase
LRINAELGRTHINAQGVRALENLVSLAQSQTEESLLSLHERIKKCTICADLPLGPRPVVQPSNHAKILIAGQAPGRIVHETGVPFNDPSGDRLRTWLGVTREQFYDPAQFAIVPMGFCFPGTGKSGDFPPRPECRTHWHDQLFEKMPQLKLKIIIGAYALDYHLGKRQSKTLTETVKRWRDFMPEYLPLPHPSPRNNIWLKRNPWFEAEVVPELRMRVAALLGAPEKGAEK